MHIIPFGSEGRPFVGKQSHSNRDGRVHVEPGLKFFSQRRSLYYANLQYESSPHDLRKTNQPATEGTEWGWTHSEIPATTCHCVLSDTMRHDGLPAFHRAVLCSLLELNAFANLCDSNKQSSSLKSCCDVKKRYIPWSWVSTRTSKSTASLFGKQNTTIHT